MLGVEFKVTVHNPADPNKPWKHSYLRSEHMPLLKWAQQGLTLSIEPQRGAPQRGFATYLEKLRLASLPTFQTTWVDSKTGTKWCCHYLDLSQYGHAAIPLFNMKVVG